MKRKLCWCILKNLGRLLSEDFWNKAIRNPNFPAWMFVKMIVLSAIYDIFLMIIKPGYPSKEDWVPSDELGTLLLHTDERTRPRTFCSSSLAKFLGPARATRSADRVPALPFESSPAYKQ